MVKNVQEAYRTPNILDQKRKSSRHIMIKTLTAQNKERILKAIREKVQVTYKGRSIRITPDFSTDMKSQKSQDRGHADPKTTQMPTQATILCNTLNQHRWRIQIFYGKKKLKILERKIQHREGTYTKEKNKKLIISQKKKPKGENQMHIMPPTTTNITGTKNHLP
jgi:hypothetical protein